MGRFDMLKWSGPSEDRWDYKANSMKAAPETKKYTYRINHDRADWQTEMRDNYRQIVRLGGN